MINQTETYAICFQRFISIAESSKTDLLQLKTQKKTIQKHSAKVNEQIKSLWEGRTADSLHLRNNNKN
jgi:hypothetical protein